MNHGEHLGFNQEQDSPNGTYKDTPLYCYCSFDLNIAINDERKSFFV